MKRFLSVLLILTIILSLFSGFVSADTTVYITKTGSKYHNAGCSHLRSSKISISLTEAINKGYTPCSDCHAPSAAHTHTWNSGKVTTAATCAKAGVKTYTCTGCGKTKTESIPATGKHTWNSGKVTTAATCSKTGVKTYTCTVCGTTKTESIPVNPNGHVWKCIEVWEQPVDDQHGYGMFECRICSTTKYDDVCPSSVFSDVKNDWSHKGIDFAVYRKITNGSDSTHFSPDAACTRGQVVTFLWRAAGCPAPDITVGTMFTDLKNGAYYEYAVAWAVQNGITNGTDDTHFNPDAICTRGQVVTFLWRFKGKPTPISENTPFKDLKTDGFYQEAVAWAMENEITNGLSADKFGPDATCTRAQVVTFLYRAMK